MKVLLEGVVGMIYFSIMASGTVIGLALLVKLFRIVLNMEI